MRPLTLGLIALWSCRPAAGADATALQTLPKLTADQGRALVRLAREGMNRYLTHRGGPEAMRLPSELRPLRGWRNAAAVTLRDGGRVVAVQVRTGEELCTNLLAAALNAMRSPRLPDRVDRKVLDALTVEVEVLSVPRTVPRRSLAAAIAPGLDGLLYGRGPLPGISASRPAGPREPHAGAMAWVLPSAGYVLGLNAEQMRRGAMLRYRLTSRNASLPPYLAVFTTRHYVGSPGGPTVELFRGKDMTVRRQIDEGALRAAAGKVGSYLVRHQAKDGRYCRDDRPASVPDHLYATYAMARLARRYPKQAFARSAALAAGHASGLVKRSGNRALVEAAGRDETLAATALLALALGQAAPDDRTLRLRAELHRGLLAELSRDAASSAPTSRPASRSAGPYVAWLALAASKDHADELRALRKAFTRASPGDFLAHLWAFRAGLVKDPLPAGAAGPEARSRGISQRAAGALPDETGGFAVGGDPPSALHTGLAALCLAGRGAAAREARRFCYRMMVQPREAYFAEDPEACIGGVRATPAGAAVSVSACAAAIEAFLAE